MTENSLSITPGLPFERYEAIGKEIGTLGRNSHFFIGDWIRYGEASYGERYAQALDVTGLKYDTVVHIKYVATHVVPQNRINGLSFSHHRAVAHLNGTEQLRLLTLAKENGFSVHQLKALVFSESGTRLKARCGCCGVQFEGEELKTLKRISACEACRAELPEELNHPDVLCSENQNQGEG